VLNTHLDHVGAGARKLGLRQILRYLDDVKLFPDAPVILMGDFNAWPDSEEMKVFDEFPGYTSAADGLGITYHGYMKSNHPECIDYIYIRGAVKKLNAYKWTDEENGVFLSDHYPVQVKVRLKGAKRW
jgi:endonuclease/exonuclease/phosphatase family metal-dependent hydrolase